VKPVDKTLLVELKCTSYFDLLRCFLKFSSIYL